MKRIKEVRKKVAIKRIEDACNEARSHIEELENYKDVEWLIRLYQWGIAYGEWRLRRLRR